MLLRQALKDSGHLRQPKQAELADSRVPTYEGWSAVMRVLGAVHDITGMQSLMPTLDGFLIDRGSISHRKKEIRRPVVHILFGSQPHEKKQYEQKVKQATANVLTKERGVMIRVHTTEQFLYDYRGRLSTLYPVYLTIEIKGICPGVLKPSRLRRVFARFRHPIKGYGQYPRGPGW